MKRKLFWIIYYTLAIILNIIWVIAFHAYWCLSWISIFPIAYFIVAVYIVYTSSPNTLRQKSKWRQFKEDMFHLQYDNRLGVISQDTVTGNFRHVKTELANVKENKLAHAQFLIISPLFLSFIFFFSATFKILSGLPFLLIPFNSVYSYFITASERVKKYEQERLEQEKREEQGKRK